MSAAFCDTTSGLPPPSVRVFESSREQRAATSAEGEDALLVRRTLDGDRAAARVLVRRLRTTIERRSRPVLLRARMLTQTLLEDATQDALLSLFRDDCALLRRWCPERNASLDPFVGQVATHVAMNLVAKVRRRARQETAESDSEVERAPCHAACPETNTAARQLARALLEELGSEERSMVVAYFAEGTSAKEVSERFGRSEHAVHVWANRLRARMTQRWAEERRP